MAHYGANFEIYRAFTLIPASHLVIPAKAGIHRGREFRSSTVNTYLYHKCIDIWSVAWIQCRFNIVNVGHFGAG